VMLALVDAVTARFAYQWMNTARGIARFRADQDLSTVSPSVEVVVFAAMGLLLLALVATRLAIAVGLWGLRRLARLSAVGLTLAQAVVWILGLPLVAGSVVGNPLAIAIGNVAGLLFLGIAGLLAAPRSRNLFKSDVRTAIASTQRPPRSLARWALK